MSLEMQSKIAAYINNGFVEIGDIKKSSYFSKGLILEDGKLAVLAHLPLAQEGLLAIAHQPPLFLAYEDNYKWLAVQTLGLKAQLGLNKTRGSNNSLARLDKNEVNNQIKLFFFIHGKTGNAELSHIAKASGLFFKVTAFSVQLDSIAGETRQNSFSDMDAMSRVNPTYENVKVYFDSALVELNRYINAVIALQQQALGSWPTVDFVTQLPQLYTKGWKDLLHDQLH